jgi:quercetin dioxygenase-like cupin family protein
MSAPLVRGPRDGHWLAWHGVGLRYLATSDETAGRYCWSDASAPAGPGVPPHRHAFAEGFYVNQGRFEVQAGPQRLTLEAGDYLHVSPDTVHAIRPLHEGPGRLQVLCVPGGFDRFQFELGTPTGPDGPFDGPSVQTIFNLPEAAAKHGIDLAPPAEAVAAGGPLHLRRATEGRLLAAAGDLYRVLAAGVETQGDYALMHATVPPGGGPPPHIHSREDEAFFVLSGSITVHLDDRALSATPGSFVHLPRGGRHWFHNDRDQPATMLVFVAPAGLEAMFEETGRPWHDPSILPGPPTREEIERLLSVAPAYGITVQLPH